jgi:hypothetical protein
MTDGVAINVSNTSTNAINLRSKYVAYNWYQGGTESNANLPSGWLAYDSSKGVYYVVKNQFIKSCLLMLFVCVEVFAFVLLSRVLLCFIGELMKGV